MWRDGHFDRMEKHWRGGFSSHSEHPYRACEECVPVANACGTIPQTGDARSRASAVLTLVYVLGSIPASLPGLDTLRQLFGLTLCEAKVARSLLAGCCVKRIALQTERSEHTIREHIKSVLRKTGSSGQAELVSLLASLPHQT